MKFLLRYILRITFCYLIVFSAPIASAQIEMTIMAIGGSLVVDRAGKELKETIDRAESAANALLGKADDIAKRHLEEINRILNNTVGGLIDKSEKAALNLLEQAKRDVEALEGTILKDVKRVIWETECAGRRLVLEDLGTALGGLGDLLNTNQIRLTPPRRVLDIPRWYTGCFWSCRDPYIVDITEPFGETYRKVRDLMEGTITEDLVTDDTPAHHLVGTYEYLSSFALKTSCFYQGSEDRYNREHIKYKERAKQWNNVVEVAL